MTTVFGFNDQISYFLNLCLIVLVVCSFAFWGLHSVKPSKTLIHLQQRIKSWWVILGLFILCFGFNTNLGFWGLALVSFVSHRELTSHFHLPESLRRVVFWSYLAIIAQYYIAYRQNFTLFLTFIPIGTCFFLTLRMILVDKPLQSIRTLSLLNWSLLITTLNLSHIAYLMSLPELPGQKNIYQSYIFFLVFVGQFNDIFQYLSGKLIGGKKIRPKISPQKTYSGSIGGLIGSVGLAYLFAPIMPLSTSQCLVLGMVISVTGLLGDLCLSAVKRDLKVKDMSQFIPGHGGILDRVDSLVFSAPAYFYLLYYWIYW